MKKSKILLIAAILGTICVVILFSAVRNSIVKSQSGNGYTQLGAAIGTALMMPSMICSAIAVIFAWVGFGTNKRAFALVSGILHAVAMVLMPSLGIIMLNVIPMILCFVAYGLMGKANKNG